MLGIYLGHIRTEEPGIYTKAPDSYESGAFYRIKLKPRKGLVSSSEGMGYLILSIASEIATNRTTRTIVIWKSVFSTPLRVR